MVYWRQYRDRVKAADSGAVLVKQVQGGSVSISQALVRTLESGYPGDVFLEWREKYGNIYNLRLPSEDFLVTIEPAHVKAMLVTQFDKFDKGPGFISQFHDFLGTGVFNSDGDMWKFHRTMMRPFFNRERITDFDIFDRHSNDAIGQATARLAAGYPIDFQDLVSRFTIDSATEFLFGHSVHTLSAHLPYPASSPLSNSSEFTNHSSNKFVKAFTAGQLLSALRARRGEIWPLMEFWENKVKSNRKLVDDFIGPVLAEKRTEMESRSYTEKEITIDDGEPLLTHLLNQIPDNQMLKDELVNLLVAGRDTTASILTFAMYMLTQHPHVTRRLREEIVTKVGNSRPTFEQVKNMKYLRAVINETLRLYPPVPFDERTSNAAALFPPSTPGEKPFYIPAKTRCLFSYLLIQRRTDLWGPDALEFDPDRFIDERLHKYLIPNPFIFVPFHAGPRICLGQQFAYNEASFFLIRLLQKFAKFKLAEDGQPAESRPPAEWSKCEGLQGTDKIWPASHLTMYVKGGLWVRMEE